MEVTEEFHLIHLEQRKTPTVRLNRARDLIGLFQCDEAESPSKFSWFVLYQMAA